MKKIKKTLTSSGEIKTVNEGTYTTTGNGSPTIYSTADITVSDATLVAKASEGVVIEGANSVTLNNCDLTDSNTKLNGQSTTYKNIFLYQSMSGDASNGTATFTAKDSNITTNNGDNTAKSITLKLDSSSKIKLTGDSYVSSLEDSDSSYSNIDFNGYKLYVNGIAIN